MKESATIAHAYSRAFWERLAPDSAFFADHGIHVHVPAGGVVVWQCLGCLGV